MISRRFVLVVGAMALAGLAWGDRIDQWIEAQMMENHIAGVGVAIVDATDRVDVRGYGYSNLETGSRFDGDTVFRIASLSKQFCAYAALTMVKEGKLGMEDKVGKYFPEIGDEVGAVTVKDLLGHRSGIEGPKAFSFRQRYSDERYVEMIKDGGLREKPGETFRYNNHAYSLLGILAGKVDGSSLQTIVKREIFDKVGMTATRYYAMEDLVVGRSDAYVWRDGRQQKMEELRPRVYEGSGGILSSLNDMVKYEMALRKGGVLDEEVLAMRRKPIFGGDSGYGGGWFLSPGEMRHTGGTMGFTSVYLRDLKSGVTVILFKNSDVGPVMEWGRKVMGLVLEGVG